MDLEKEVRAPESLTASNQNGTQPSDSDSPMPPKISSLTALTVHPPPVQAGESQSVRPTSEGLPIWMQRLFLVIFVILCIEVGLVMVAVPWLPVWSDNGLLMNLPQVKTFLRLGFVRGIVSGVGLLDIWIGIWEAVHYRDRKAV